MINAAHLVVRQVMHSADRMLRSAISFSFLFITKAVFCGQLEHESIKKKHEKRNQQCNGSPCQLPSLVDRLSSNHQLRAPVRRHPLACAHVLVPVHALRRLYVRGAPLPTRPRCCSPRRDPPPVFLARRLPPPSMRHPRRHGGL